MTWRSINDDPPKDGTEILVWSPMFGGKYFLATWDDDKYAKTPRPYFKLSDQRLFGTTAARANQPTHWMPLPAAPGQEDQSQ